MQHGCLQMLLKINKRHIEKGTIGKISKGIT